MNLVQIQERLKDMPTQALMAYANGMNPEVPPYLALGELNRRRTMQQQMQAPTGSVKERIETEVGMPQMKQQATEQMAMDAMKKQQMMQQMMQMAQQMPQGAPQQMPQQMPQPVGMAYGGIATVNVPDDVTMYGSGGIVAFAGGGDTDEPTEEEIEEAKKAYIRDFGKLVRPSRPEGERDIGQILSDAAKRFGNFLIPEYEYERKVSRVPEGGVEVGRGGAYRGMRTEVPRNMGAPARTMPAQEDPERVAEALAILESERQKLIAAGDAAGLAGVEREIDTMKKRLPGAPPVAQAGIPAAQMPQPTVGTAAFGVPGAATQMVQTAGPNYQQMLADQVKQGKTYEQKRAEAEAKDPYLKKQPGEMLEQYIKQMQDRDTQEQTRFDEMEKERARAALWRGLIAAGEASRGQRGIGALMGGFGKVVGEEMEAGRVRETAMMKAKREQQNAIVKMQQEIENARIARAEGRFKDANTHDEKADDNRRAAIQKGAEIQAQNERNTADIASRERVAGMPGSEERLFRQYAEAWLAKPENRGKTMADAYAAFKAAGSPAAAARGQMTFDQALDNARAEFKDQNPLVWQAMERKAAAQEKRPARTLEQAITERAKQLMAVANGAPAPTGGPVIVTGPDGRQYSFPNQDAANRFKQAAGIR